MPKRTCRVGIHGRNQEHFSENDFRVIRDARIEVVKMMSQTKPEVFDRITRDNPGLEIITRLYDDRMNTGGHPSPQQFADKMIPIMRELKPFCTKFQIHNEPNHRDRIEGWGPKEEDARSFNTWFLQVYDLLKTACSWASLGFPGLAIPDFIHHDRLWLRVCRPAIQKADWLGVHCYWQTPPDRPSVIMDPMFGLTFKFYHKQFPNKTLEILECGNSNVQSDWHRHWAIPEEAVAQEYVRWLQEVFKHDYINSASFFILSSQDPQWSFFSWRTENNHIKPVVQWVAQMHRPPLGEVAEPAEPTQPPDLPVVLPEPGQWTNQQIITAFHHISRNLGLGNWTLMGRAGLKLMQLVRDRNGPYTGPAIEDLPRLTDEHKALLKAKLADLARPIAEAVVAPGFLREQSDLAAISLDLPRWLRVSISPDMSNVEKRAAVTWNRYGYLLMHLADRLGMDLGLAIAVLAAESDRRGLARDGRLVLRLENHVFYDHWGKDHEAQYRRHFRFDPAQPWTRHQWRPGADLPWRDAHRNHGGEWEAFEFACTLDERAAKLSSGLGLAQVMGFSYSAAGYESVGQMFDAFSSSERYQIFALFDLIAGPSAQSRQIEALREQDLDTFAVLHYGSRRAARYSGILASLFEAFQQLNPT